jgi:SAM-dependent methyltransferase
MILSRFETAHTFMISFMTYRISGGKCLINSSICNLKKILEKRSFMASRETINAELKGSLEESKKTDKKKFLENTKSGQEYGGNHVLQMMSHINKTDQIVELGAGSGWASAMLYSHGYRNLLITDINPYDFNGLDAVKRLVKGNIRTKIMDFENIGLKPGSVDVMFMMSALHHSSNIGLVAREVFRTLRPGGSWFILGEPVRGWLDGQNKDMKKSNSEGFNDNFYYWTHYVKEIKKAGFRIDVIFPLEMHKFLSGELKDNAKSRHKKILLSLAKSFYKNRLGRYVIKKSYPKSLYFMGSHSVIMCKK